MQTIRRRDKTLPGMRVGSSFRKIVNSLFACSIDKQADHYIKIANHFLVNNGPIWACARLKDYYNIGCKISLELDFDNIPFCRTKDNIPRDMQPFLSYLKSPDLNKRRACLTLLRSYTQIFCQADLDTTSVEAPCPSELPFLRYEAHFVRICEKIKGFTEPYLRDEGLFTSAKAGPNGHAMLNVDKDFAAISSSNLLVSIKLLNRAIEDVAKKSSKREVSLSSGFAPDFDCPPDEDMINYMPRSERKEELYNAMEKFIQWRLKKEPKAYDKVKTSKLSFLAEGGCKTRVVAIGDYFSQDCLKPIHKSLYRILNRLDTDGTSSHNRISQVVKDRTSKGLPVWSYDLTNATDRFPIFIQKKMMSVMYGPEISTLWADIMTDREFFVDANKYVRYSTGQPMGLLSSWAAFALTHHIIVETCAAIVGIKSFKDYVVIGDDVTIFDKRVAHEYEVFLETFNIQISKAKSLKSDGNPSSAEIAKRLFINGSEVSPIPRDAIESSIQNYLLIPNLIRLCMERDVPIKSHQRPVEGALKEIFRNPNKVLTLLSCPILDLPFGDGQAIWPESSIVIEEFDKLKLEFISSKAKDLYENELANIPNMGILGSALEADDGPSMLNLHPLFSLLRAYRDRCGSIYQGILIKGFSSEDVRLIPFLINPMIPNYIRRTHQIEKVRSSLILKTYKSLVDKAALGGLST